MAKKINKYSKIFIDKSNENLKASELCIKKGFYNASVSCSFYSVFLTIKAGLTNIAEENKDFDREQIKQKYNKHLNENLKNKFLRDKLKKYFDVLLKNRNKADYDIDLFKENVTKEYYKISDELNNKLRSLFNL